MRLPLFSRPLIWGFFSLSVLAAAPAWADDAPAPEAKTLDISVGGGPVVRPTFVGSDRYTVSASPAVEIKWNGKLTLGPDGLSADWKQGDFRYGVGLVYGAGRNDKGSNSIFGSGDDRLVGLGKIDSAFGLKLFGGYRLGWANFELSASKYEGSQNKGLLVDFGVRTPIRLSPQLVFIPRIGLDWADGGYTETFFGVTQAQAADSMFPVFKARAGLEDIAAGGTLAYQLNRRWRLGSVLTVKRFEGDVAKSPITFSNVNAWLGVFAIYSF